ncbi:glycosyl hydrolase [Granulicella sp. WH15]|nr:glycosyl hydrolase [Granulicella sp. WH15]
MAQAAPAGPQVWRNIGPDRGGRSLTSAGSSLRPNEYYFGAVGGGLWKTVDGGATWKPITDQKIHSSSVGAMAIAQSNPDIVYVGMGESELRGNVMQGDGVYKTTDGGKTWANVGLNDTQAISRIRVDAHNPDLVYAAVLGHPYGPSAERGVFRSTDGGKSWKKILYENDHAGAEDLAIDPRNPKVMFATIWDVQRTPWSLSSGGPASKLYKSVDGGDTWKDITRNPGLPEGTDGKIGIAISADSNTIYTLVENENGGLYRSDNAGDTWTKVSEDRNIRQRAFYYTRLTADPKDKNTLYFTNVNFYRSFDGGKTIHRLQQPHGDNHDLWIDPQNPNRMIESNDGGGTVSVDHAETWTPETYPTAQLYHVATTTDIPYQVCGAQQDNTTICVASKGGSNFHNPVEKQGLWMYPVGGGESGYIAPDPKNPNIFFAGSQGAMLTKYDRRDGQSQDIQPYPFFFSGQSAASLKERWQWTFPIVFDPLDPNTMYASSQHLFKTTNAGKSWTIISPDLTLADPKTLGDSGGPITKDQNGPEIYATIFSIAPSRLEKGTIWTGSDDGLAFITKDGGANWAKITPEGLPHYSRIGMIDASWHKPGTAYLAANRYQMDDFAPYIYKTSDYGQHWTKITDGIPANDFVRVIREDRVRPGLLYAGTEHSIYVSYDDGAHWKSLAYNLPDTQIADIVVEKYDLVIATHGRSFYILDDIDWLRQTTPETLNAKVHLFQPHPATRNLGDAAIDYFLAKPVDEVKVEVLDSSNKVIGTFVSLAPGKKAAEDEDDGEGRRPSQKPPTNKEGMNRFQWNLRYPAAYGFPGMVVWGAAPKNGPMAVPGMYHVKLTAGGVTQTRDLEVLKDPRVDATQEDLQRQFDLAWKIRNEFEQANLIVGKIRGIRKQVNERLKESPDAALKSQAEELLAKQKTIEEIVYQTKNRSNQDPLNFQIRLNNYIATLDKSVMMGDAAPTAQAYEVDKELNGRLDEQQRAFDQTVSVELGKLNETLKAKKLKPVEVSAEM